MIIEILNKKKQYKNQINNSISTIQEKKYYVIANQKIYHEKNKLNIKDKLISEKLNKLKELHKKSQNEYFLKYSIVFFNQKMRSNLHLL